MASKDIEIVVDSREKVKQRTLIKHNGIAFTVKALSCGDYAAYADDGKVTIERKAISDLELKDFHKFIISLFGHMLCKHRPRNFHFV